MEIDFYKIQTCRNDFVLISYLYKGEPPSAELLPRIAHTLCDRREGVGANGVIFLVPGIEHPVRISVLLEDGTEAPLHNDALMCVGRFAFDSGVSGGDRIAVESTDGVRTVDFIDSSHFRVRLGVPKTHPGGSDLREQPDAEYQRTVEVDGKRISITPLNLSLPGAVVFSEESSSRLRQLGKGIRGLGLHPIFCSVYSKDELSVRTWFEREPADYSSACAVATVGAVVNGFAERDVVVHCNKHDLYIQWVESPNEVLVTGTADYVFSGTFYFDEEEEQ
ncbi:MAG TPA: hypothetical protein VMV68_05895 [Spirochaetia bacterium]|nr:hypothetical protein [Spirochaetia bacterium]